MNHQNQNQDESNTAATDAASSTDTCPRGAVLRDAEQRSAVDHTEYERSHDPDSELHLDGGDGGLYNDGLDIGDDADTLAGTDGDSPKGIKG
jgi:hypothetical protein